MLDAAQVRKLKQHLSSTNLRLSEELTHDLYENAIVPAAIAWFNDNSSVLSLQEDIQKAVHTRWPILQVKLEEAMADFEDQARVQISSSPREGAPEVDSQSIIGTLNERVAQVVAALGTTFVAMICGGSGMALIATGPLGIVLGVIVGLVAYVGGREKIEDWVGKNLLDKHVPMVLKSLVKGKVTSELKRTEVPFQQKLFEMLQEQTKPIMEAFDASTR